MYFIFFYPSALAKSTKTFVHTLTELVNTIGAIFIYLLDCQHEPFSQIIHPEGVWNHVRPNNGDESLFFLTSPIFILTTKSTSLLNRNEHYIAEKGQVKVLDAHSARCLFWLERRLLSHRHRRWITLYSLHGSLFLNFYIYNRCKWRNLWRLFNFPKRRTRLFKRRLSFFYFFFFTS